MPKLNKKHITLEQKDMMLAFMLSHKDLAQGRMSGSSYKQESDELYETMTELLNNVENGAVKTMSAWRKIALDSSENLEDGDLKEGSIDFESFKTEEEKVVIGTSKQIDIKDDSAEPSKKQSATKRKSLTNFLNTKREKLSDAPIVIESDEEYEQDVASKIKGERTWV
ncbi:uncharacterized protein LOC122505301 [Leptopilina heterotoma]|uniref:uncharacterized protein LOC122505301 n=1 Tax=Leptopilina heterotoma TaxID=63436 RepID=UPI001CA8DC91|nr:uncharacterized protein LOC122505301 [Leptopilina heterotoma]